MCKLVTITIGPARGPNRSLSISSTETRFPTCSMHLWRNLLKDEQQGTTYV